MGTQGQGRKRIANRERLSAEDDALNLIAREAEARLAAKRAARAEAREIRMKELERQQKEIYQVQKKYYGLDTKFGDIEQWMEDSEKYSRRFRRHTSASDEDDWTSVGSRGSVRADYDRIGASGGVAEKSRKKKKKPKAANGFDELSCGSGPSKESSRSSWYSDGSLKSARQWHRKETAGSYYSDLPPYGTGLGSKSHSTSQNGTRVSAYDGIGSRRYSTSSSHAPSEHNCFLGSSSRTSSRASSARASPVVEERLEKEITEKGSRAASSLSAATLASLGGTLSRRGSGETTTSMDTEGSIREIKEIFELKDQIQDVEGKYMEGLKELKDSLAEVEEKYKKAMVSNAQLDNEKTNLMYQVDTLRESLLELEEQLAETHRMHEEKTKELDRQKHAYSLLQSQFETIKETLKEREEMLMEIKGLNQKQRSSAQEIADLQETVEWKDKKIGALERQKEYSDAIRIDRDELRDEVAMLKERLKAYGMLTNGEAEPVRKEGNAHTQAAETEPQAAAQLRSSSDSPLGESHELQMRNEILETVGKRGILQNTGIDEQMKETGNREMLMDNVQEKDITEECEELTESETPAMTIRDNGDSNQIEHTAANLDDGEQSACDTQKLGGKEVSEGMNSILGSGEGNQSCGSREENESDFGAKGKHVHVDINQNLNHNRRRPRHIGEQGTNGGIREETHPEVGNDLVVVHVDSVGTGADNQAIMEETQKVVQLVLENAIEILQQHMCGHELSGETRDQDEEVTQVEGGLVQMKGEKLTRKQEKPESVHVEAKELDGMVVKETGPEQVAIGDTELYCTAQETEICSESFHNDLARENREAEQVLSFAPGQNGQFGSGGEGVNYFDCPVQDGAENEERIDQNRSEQPVDNASRTSVELEEEVEKLAEKVETGTNSLSQAAQKEVEVDEEVACHLKGVNGLIVGDEVKQLIVTGEDPDWRDEGTVTGRVEGCLQDGEVKDQGLEKEVPPVEAESGPGAEQGDGASEMMQQGKVEGKLKHGYLQEMTPTGGETKVGIEAENQATGIESNVMNYDKDNVKGHGEVEEEVKNPGNDEARSYGENEDMDDIKAQGGEREVRGHNTEGKGYKREIKKESDHGKGESKVKNTRKYEDEMNDSHCGQVKGQGEKEGETNDSDGQSEIENHEKVQVVVEVPEEVKVKGDQSEAQGSSASEFNGFEKEEGKVKGRPDDEGAVEGFRVEKGEVKGAPEEEGEVKGTPEQEGEVKGTPEEEGEVKDPREEEDEVEGAPEEESEVEGPREEDEVEGVPEEEGEVKGAPEEDGEVNGAPEDKDVKGTPEEEGEVKYPREEEDEVKGPREEGGEIGGVPEAEAGVKGPREEAGEGEGAPEEEGEVKDAPEEEGAVEGFRVEKGEVKGSSEEEGKVKGSPEEEGEVKDSREEEDEVKIAPKEEGEVKGPREEGGEIGGVPEEEAGVNGPREEEGKVESAPEKEGEVKDAPEEEGAVEGFRVEKGEVKSSPEEEGKVKGSPEEEGKVKDAPEEEGEVKSAPNVKGEVKGPSEEQGEVKYAPEEEGAVEGFRVEKGEVKSSPEEEGKVKGSPEEEGKVKDAPEEEGEVQSALKVKGEVKGPSEEQGEVKDAPEEEGAVEGFRVEKGEVKSSPEEEGKVKDAPEEEGEVKDAPEEEGAVEGFRFEKGKVKGSPEEEGKVKGSPEEEGKVKDAPEEEGEVKSAPKEEGEVKDPREEQGEVGGFPELVAGVKGPREEGGEIGSVLEEEARVKGLREEEDEVEGAPEEEGDVKGALEEEGKVKDAPEEEGKVKSAPEEEVVVKGPREEEGEVGGVPEVEGGVKGPRKEGEVKSTPEKEGEIKGLREEGEVEGPPEDATEGEGPPEKEGDIKGTKRRRWMTSKIPERGRSVLNWRVRSYFSIIWRELWKKWGRRSIYGQVSVVVQESGKGNQIQSKCIEETNEDTPENNTQDVHQVTDRKGEQGTPTKEETEITEEATGQEGMPVKNGEQIRQVPETSSSFEEFGEKAQMSAEVVNYLDERTIYELNKESEEVAQESLQQGPVKSGVVLVNVIGQGMIMQDGKREVPVKEEGNSSGTSKKPDKAQRCETRKEKADDAPVSQTDVEEQELRGDDEDAEEGHKFEWDDETSEILEDETLDKKEMPEGTEQKGKRTHWTEKLLFSKSSAKGRQLICSHQFCAPTVVEFETVVSTHSVYFRVIKFIDEKEALLEQIKKLKAQLDERSKSGKAETAASSDTILENGTDVQMIEVQRDANRQISEYKFKLTKTEQEITALEQNIARLENQVLRYKTAAENAEKVEDELKAEKRKLQREVRSALDKIEELEMSNSHLSKRLEKMKANRSALLSQQ
ncbi:uncharacterized protein LOC119962274 [Scyliorhinus canicula]|uniref:uncharacterized protein LOC119962274 n=1 Tax=Scyliorhinus canicula TaxID=7830 RepID=UPI0018F69EB5|nr:uncharacterized protein LOC119962274 [Scyliorhinus canicula]